jgi:hypothetical protein
VSEQEKVQPDEAELESRESEETEEADVELHKKKVTPLPAGPV